MQDLIERRAALTALCEDCLQKYEGICPHPAYFRDSVIYCDDCDMVFTLDDCQASDDEICEAWNTRYLTEYIVKLPEPPKGVQSDDT